MGGSGVGEPLGSGAAVAGDGGSAAAGIAGGAARVDPVAASGALSLRGPLVASAGTARAVGGAEPGLGRTSSIGGRTGDGSRDRAGGVATELPADTDALVLGPRSGDSDRLSESLLSHQAPTAPPSTRHSIASVISHLATFRGRLACRGPREA